MSHRIPVPVFSGLTGKTINTSFPSLIEMQAFIARLVREFQFSVVEEKEIRLTRAGLLVPTVLGEEEKGPQLPLKVSTVRRDMRFTS